jgi:hypothetical protein
MKPDLQLIATHVYGSLSVEPSTLMVEAVIKAYEEWHWYTDDPGDKYVLAKFKHGCEIVRRCSGGYWYAKHGQIITSKLICWRPLPC